MQLKRIILFGFCLFSLFLIYGCSNGNSIDTPFSTTTHIAATSTVTGTSTTSTTSLTTSTTTTTTTTITTTTTTTTTITTTSTLGPLHVRRNQIVDADNNPVVLKGVSLADPYFLDKYDGQFNEAMFATLESWGVKIVRVPVHPGAWIGKADYAETYLDPIVEWGNKYGMYIILDWHAIGNPCSGEEDLQSWENEPPWDSVYHPVYESDLTYARQALMAWAERYENKPWVMYEIFNEPAITGTSYTWADWKVKAEDLIDAI